MKEEEKKASVSDLLMNALRVDPDIDVIKKYAELKYLVS